MAPAEPADPTVLARIVANPSGALGHAEQTGQTLMQEAGLLACGATAADYRCYGGETPRQTRQDIKTSPR